MRVLLFCILTLSASLCLADPIGQDDAAIQAIANPIMDNILDGIKSGDYNKYVKDFDSMLKTAIPESRFLEVNNKVSTSIGTCQQKQYLGFLNKQNMTLVIWRAKFDKSADDILIKLVITKSADSYLVTGLWFDE